MSHEPMFEAPAFNPVWEALRRACAVVEFDLRGNVLAVNGAFLSMFGYAPEEAVGMAHAALAAPDADPDLWARVARGEARTVAARFRAKNGASIALQATYAPALGDDGRPVKIVMLAAPAAEAAPQTELEPEPAPKRAGAPGDIEWIVDPAEFAAKPAATEAPAEPRAGQARDAAPRESRRPVGAVALRAAVADAARNAEAAARAEAAVRALDPIAERIDDAAAAALAEIAHRIEMLAFNAAIEAARAGEAGRGFEAVADQAEKIALRATEAVKDATRALRAAARGIGAAHEAARSARATAEGLARGVAALIAAPAGRTPGEGADPAGAGAE